MDQSSLGLDGFGFYHVQERKILCRVGQSTTKILSPYPGLGPGENPRYEQLAETGRSAITRIFPTPRRPSNSSPCYPSKLLDEDHVYPLEQVARPRPPPCRSFPRYVRFYACPHPLPLRYHWPVNALLPNKMKPRDMRNRAMLYLCRKTRRPYNTTEHWIASTASPLASHSMFGVRARLSTHCAHACSLVAREALGAACCE